MLLSLSTNPRKTIIKVLDDAIGRQRSSIQQWQRMKYEFLKLGNVPKFLNKSEGCNGKVNKQKQVPVSFEYLSEARRILDFVNTRFGNGDHYLNEVFGEPISQSEATRYLLDYLERLGLEGALQILWSKDISCCGRIMWTGPSVRFNRPEKMRYSLWLKSTSENMYLRKEGIKGLADHEIGTHYLRMRNDGFQPWFSNRKAFGLRSLHSTHLKTNEEGFAALNTLLQLKCRLLWRPAFLYYTACMSVQMTFKELYDHLESFILDSDQRWKHVLRVKRHLEDCNGYGGSGKDQCYFAGAVRILRNSHDIDFKNLYAGKLCYDELTRVKRISRGSIKLPHFLNDIDLYREALREMLYVNCLQPAVTLGELLPRIKVHRKRNVKMADKRRNAKTQPRRDREVKVTMFDRSGKHKMYKTREFARSELFAIG